MSWQEQAEPLLEGGQSSREAPAQVQLPTEQGAGDLMRSDLQLEQSWEGLYNRLSVIRQAELALYVIIRPFDPRRIEAGRRRGLYSSASKLYACVDERWYRVDDIGGEIRVVNPDIAPKEGPELVSINPGKWRFAAEPPLPQNIAQAEALAAQRLEQLRVDQQRREELDAEYDRLSAAFDVQAFTDDATLQDLAYTYTAAGARKRIEDELLKADRARWSAMALLDALQRRRQLIVVRDYTTLRNKFCASVVKARRNEVWLLEGKRRVLMHEDKFALSWFDAPSMDEVVLNEEKWKHVAARLPGYAALQRSAINAARDAEKQFAEMIRTGRVADASVLSLETSLWAGRRISLKWQEMQLRTLAMMCFKPDMTIPRCAVFDVIQEMTSLCSLKLLTRRALFVKGRFNWDERLRVLNDVLDNLVLAEARVFYAIGPLPDSMDNVAVGAFRTFIRSLRQEVEGDLIDTYRGYEGIGWEAASARVESGSKRLVDTVLNARVIGNRRRVGDQDFVDVLEPTDHRVVWTFSNVGTSQEPAWRELAKQLARPSDSSSDMQLVLAGTEAKRLWHLAGRRFTQFSDLETITRMSPRCIRAEWLKYAQKMHGLRNSLEEALEAYPSSLVHPFYRDTPRALDEEILRFLQQGPLVQNRMIAQGPPTSEGLLTLVNAWQARVVEIPAASPLVREFEVRERSTERPLWFARFYYATPQAKEVGYHYTRGNLKRYIDRNTSYAKLKLRASSNERLINAYRTNIDHEVAEAVFFTDDNDSSSA